MANLIMMGILGGGGLACAKCKVVVSNEQTLEGSQLFGTFFWIQGLGKKDERLLNKSDLRIGF
jgi:hypothetical protein